jgi:8-oxo-dGTP diphosphatase
MEHKISTGVIIPKDNKILLIKHVHPENGFTWWVPPGGGIKGTESLFDAAKREVFEESGLKVELDKLLFMRQLIYRVQNKNVVTTYLLANLIDGDLTIENIKGAGMDEHFIKEAKFFSKEEIQEIKVFPEHLQSESFWDDLNAGFPQFKFLGTELDQEKND